jgi:hypothetical protein
MPEHFCKLTVMPEGEAVCLDCGAYYIYSTTLEGPELAEVRQEAAERARAGSCVNLAPHHSHDWFDGMLRVNCPGVPEPEAPS